MLQFLHEETFLVSCCAIVLRYTEVFYNFPHFELLYFLAYFLPFG
jgi:hypothetical protein